MKIRNGFVSNSSSSSFVVAFPRKPKSTKDVLQFMFNGKEGGVGLEYYDDGLSYRQVSETVFNDIDHGNAVKAGLKNIIDVFRYRYHYDINGHTLFGSFPDELGGRWSCGLGRYCGNNKDVLAQYREYLVDHEQKEKELREEGMRIQNKSRINESPYIYEGGTDPYTKKPYTKEQIKNYNNAQKALDKFRKTNPEYVAWSERQQKFWQEDSDVQEEFRNKLAKEDAQNFLDDNKGKYIFIVSYGDENGQAIMEHGNIFRNVPHVQINMH